MEVQRLKWPRAWRSKVEKIGDLVTKSILSAAPTVGEARSLEIQGAPW